MNRRKIRVIIRADIIVGIGVGRVGIEWLAVGLSIRIVLLRGVVILLG